MMIKVTCFDSYAMLGYKQITTFFQDFGIAENFGIDAIKDTYNRVFKEWKSDYKFFTEFVMVLNWKSCEHEADSELCKLYADLYYKARDWALNNLTGDELQYFIRTTD